MATETVLESIIAFLFGHKYYANIILTKGLDKYEITSFIHRSKEDADRHRKAIGATTSFSFVETISFRSRMDY